jgi:hypothetical protein
MGILARKSLYESLLLQVSHEADDIAKDSGQHRPSCEQCSEKRLEDQY